ncbi:uncharacterized protein EV420DRAFT_1645421 [Desarmillaria tabescens]|uniref:AMP-dependent synthetase/ligase domain-containing protein n=1 Tax=Armillaria tabescens TaxID=1929756 RepID=A0AA39N0P9_ARMTA|nr:uncharacterized protein EV420DRAFT_1645421 [Desarmillaria tabescens]KAK0452900.1 hypothetical protein EV420DRAFT_1645421 [Desarmillaria tabescens]
MTGPTHWKPRCSIEEADTILTAPGSPLEIETQDVDGRVLKVWKNLSPSVRAFFLHATKEHVGKTCVVYEKERYTFQQMLEMVVTAAMFRDVYGVKKCDRVVICSRNLLSYYTVFWACHLLCAVTALVAAIRPSQALYHTYEMYTDPERAEQIEPIAADLKRASGASGYLVLQDHEGKGHWEGWDGWSEAFLEYRKDPGEILRDDPRIIPEDNATIIFTSGTTGLPKGILSTQRAFLTFFFNSASTVGRDYIRRGVPIPSSLASGMNNGILLSSPLFHATGTSATLTGAFYGTKMILMIKWNVAEAVRLCKEEGVISLGGVPSLITDLADSPLSGSPIEVITIGGAPVALSLLRRSKEAFPHATLGQGYGSTETNATSVGFCSSKWVLTIDGWVMTGDLGCIDEEGYVYVKDRIKDIIIRGGESVDSWTSTMGVAGAGWRALPDERLGELVTALVTVKPRYHGKPSEKKLLETAKRLLPKFAVPIMIILKDGEFDHTPSGKTVKAQSRIIARKEWLRRRKEDTQMDEAKSKL